MKRSTVKPSGVSAASSTSNTAPVAGVTLGAAISAFARSSGSIEVITDRLYPFVSSEVETPIVLALNPMGISTSPNANGYPAPFDKAVEGRWYRPPAGLADRSEEHTSELQSLM